MNKGISITIIASLLMLSACSSKNYDSFVTCLNEKDVKFYGAFWCPHCQNQKRLFGSSADNLPYIECSNEDRTQNELCKEQNIQGYPTWEFPGDVRISGEMSLEDISRLSGCPING